MIVEIRSEVLLEKNEIQILRIFFQLFLYLVRTNSSLCSPTIVDELNIEPLLLFMITFEVAQSCIKDVRKSNSTEIFDCRSRWETSNGPPLTSWEKQLQRLYIQFTCLAIGGKLTLLQFCPFSSISRLLMGCPPLPGYCLDGAIQRENINICVMRLAE